MLQILYSYNEKGYFINVDDQRNKDILEKANWIDIYFHGKYAIDKFNHLYLKQKLL